MYARNPRMLEKGYGPASEVAKKLLKSLSTVHRLVNDGHIDGARDGRALYVSMGSAETYFRNDGNATMADVCRAMRIAFEVEGKKLLKQATAKNA